VRRRGDRQHLAVVRQPHFLSEPVELAVAEDIIFTLTQLVVSASYSRTRTRPPNGAPPVPSADGAPIATLVPSNEIETDSAEN
jgi:hypothetical protein